MSNISKNTQISIIKTILVNEQFDLIKYYIACIEKNRVPLSFRVKIIRGKCIIVSDYEVKELLAFLHDHKCFITLYQIVSLFNGHTPFNDLKKEYERIISSLVKPSLRSLICFDKLYSNQMKKLVKQMSEFKSKLGKA